MDEYGQVQMWSVLNQLHGKFPHCASQKSRLCKLFFVGLFNFHPNLVAAPFWRFQRAAKNEKEAEEDKN